jgi:hypothetical protein
MTTKRDADIAREVKASLNLFERAHVGDPVGIEPKQARSVLGVLDGSTQDALTLGLVDWLGERLGCERVLLDAREAWGEGDLAEAQARAQARSLPRGQGASFEQILAGVQAAGAELLVAPSPYGRDLETVGADSTGTVIDVLLARTPVPLIVVRRPFALGPAGPGRAVLTVARPGDAAREAAAWALGLLRAGESIELRLALEANFLEELEALLDRASPEAEPPEEGTLLQAQASRHASLHRGLQKAAERRSLSYALTLAGRDAAEAELGSQLSVAALDRGDAAAHGRVLDRIRESAHPVLVVPWGGQAVEEP